MLKLIYVYDAKSVCCGTYDYIKELEKRGVLKILKTEYYNTIKYYDSNEDLEYIEEKFRIVVEEPSDINPTGYDFMGCILLGLGLKEDRTVSISKG